MKKFPRKFIGIFVLNLCCVVWLAPEGIQAEEIKCEAGFIPERGEIMLGEPLFVTFYVTNTSAQTFYLETGGDYRGVRSSRFQFKATDADGHPAPDPNPDASNFGGIISNRKVLPHECYVEKIYLPLWVKFEHTGEYVVHGQREIQLLGEAGFSRNYAMVQKLNSDFKLTVQPTDLKRMGERIQQLASQLNSSEAANATRQLDDIEDDRVVPYLAQIVEQDKRDALVYALEGLGKHPSQTAIHILTNAVLSNVLQARGDDYQQCVAAEALGNMKSPLAVDALILALNNGNEGFRAQIARSLGRLGDRRAVEPLKAHLENSGMLARLACVETLQTLGESFHAEWVLPVIQSKQLNEFQEAAWFVRRNAGTNAPVLLARCLDMTNSSVTNYYNYTLTWQITACGGPHLTYHHNFDHEGTPEQIEDNQRTLKTLANWASSF